MRLFGFVVQWLTARAERGLISCSPHHAAAGARGAPPRSSAWSRARASWRARAAPPTWSRGAATAVSLPRRQRHAGGVLVRANRESVETTVYGCQHASHHPGRGAVPRELAGAVGDVPARRVLGAAKGIGDLEPHRELHQRPGRGARNDWAVARRHLGVVDKVRG
jgi:hypothetical protein